MGGGKVLNLVVAYLYRLPPYIHQHHTFYVSAHLTLSIVPRYFHHWTVQCEVPVNTLGKVSLLYRIGSALNNNYGLRLMALVKVGLLISPGINIGNENLSRQDNSTVFDLYYTMCVFSQCL